MLAASDSLARAETAFAKALELCPRFAPGYVNYADFLRRSQRLTEAETILRQGISLATEPAACHHSLGLLLVGQDDLPAAIEQLGLAVAQMPGDARFGYVYAVALHSGGNLPASLDVLEAVMNEVVAEGVEDASQLRVLEALGCTRAQGFFLARPMNLENLKDLLEA